MTDAAIQLENVTLHYAQRDAPPFVALHDLTLTVERGTFLSVVGPSGCGKSTLLSLVAGLLSPTLGTITVNGQPVRAVQQDIGFIFQQDVLFPWKTVLGNVMSGLIFRQVSRREAKARAQEWIRRVGLTGFEGHYPKQLSGGMRKRVSMAQAFAYDPDVLLMDEPFGALDVQTRTLMENELLALWQGTGKTVLFITHDLEEAIALSDEVAVMTAGPAGTIKERYAIDLPRPRNLLDMRAEPRFEMLYRQLWADLREEVLAGHVRATPEGCAV